MHKTITESRESPMSLLEGKMNREKVSFFFVFPLYDTVRVSDACILMCMYECLCGLKIRRSILKRPEA